MYKKALKIFHEHRIGRYYPFRVIDNIIFNKYFSYFKPNFVEVIGHKMFLSSKDPVGLSVGSYEPLETELIKKVIKKGDAVLDIGAHIGYYTLIFAKLVSDEGKVFAFEPDPNNFALLKKNVEINSYRNVILVQKAVSNKTGKIRLYLSEKSSADHRIYDLHDNRKSIEIEVIRLDDYFKNYNGRINFIKIDVQAAEGGVIQGMPLILQKNKDLKILTEFWPLGLVRFGKTPEKFLKLLIKHNFKIYRINEHENKIEHTNIAELLEIYTPEKRNQTNLLCV